MSHFRCVYVFTFLFFVLSIQGVFPSLLPDTVVQVGKNKYSYVEDLQEGQLVSTLNEKFPNDFCRTRIHKIQKEEKSFDKAILIELKPKGGGAGLLMVGEDQYFHRQNALAKSYRTR